MGKTYRRDINGKKINESTCDYKRRISKQHSKNYHILKEENKLKSDYA